MKVIKGAKETGMMISDGGRRVNGGVGGGGAMAEAADGRSEARMNEWRMNGEWEAGEAASGIGEDGIIATKARGRPIGTRTTHGANMQ